MLDNFAWLIDQFGHVPNGNRSYYLSRSQPPFFAAMVELVARRDGDAAYRKYLPQLRREYAFWMEGAGSLAPGRGASARRAARRRHVLNRYWDDRDYAARGSVSRGCCDARASRTARRRVYRNLRAAAESGWDFSSRWLADGKTLATIHTTDFDPARSQQPAVSAGADDRESAAKSPRDAACAKDMRDARGTAQERPSNGICGIRASAHSRTMTGARRRPATA